MLGASARRPDAAVGAIGRGGLSRRSQASLNYRSRRRPILSTNFYRNTVCRAERAQWSCSSHLPRAPPAQNFLSFRCELETVVRPVVPPAVDLYCIEANDAILSHSKFKVQKGAWRRYQMKFLKSHDPRDKTKTARNPCRLELLTSRSRLTKAASNPKCNTTACKVVA